jgi:epsilon-lactone hydrolase
MVEPCVFDAEAHVTAFSKLLGQATTVADMRRAFETYPIESSPVANTVMVNIGDPPGTWIGDPTHVMGRRGVYLHGGGYIAGSIQMYAGLVSRLAVSTRSWIFVPDIPSAPERQYPAAHDAAIGACRHAFCNGPYSREDAISLFLVGDSCGAALALATGMRLRDKGEVNALSAIVGLSPTLDMRAAGESYIRWGSTDKVISREMTRQCIAMYAPGIDPSDPMLSPIHSEDEAVFDDSTLAASLARQQGCPIEVQTWPGLPHVWHLLAPQLPEATFAIQCAGQFIRKVLGDEDR